jgi:hypothetical protein
MADNKRAVAAARKHDVKAALWLLKRWRKWLPSETVEILENLSSKRKVGHPPVWADADALNAYVYELVEAAKERGSSITQAWKQVTACFEAGTVHAHRKARFTKSDMWKSYYSKVGPKSYSYDQIKRAYYRGRALGPDVRGQYGFSGDRSLFKASLGKLEAKPARPRSGAGITRISRF